MYIGATLLALYSLFPFIWMLVSSFKPRGEIRSRTPSLWIDSPTIDNYVRVLVDAGFLGFIWNSFKVAVIVALLSLAVSIMAGYAFSRFYRARMVKTSNFFMLVSQMIPGVLLLVPLYIVMSNLGILENHLSLVIAYTTFVIPLCTFMMSTGFDNIPKSLEESAEIDGCGRFATVWRIIVPVSVPTIISVGLYAFISAWNEFMFAYIFISHAENRLLTPAIMLFKGANLVDWGAIMAASVVAVIPTAVLFIFLQRYFMAGMMAGAVKG
ncbi:carbohydrate ABC transporter permease [Tessaracoccus caeni]|uniref:carbohydrate ABC transporter permease n=1 Tax=Tessaracoccus caeni TaxID=3031239 RepID=UPI0023DC908A|nr:carbohydrate ABC transporter permease [Tessaracoccus caeni]MDF1488332.1 carbohydrate ABC transporter permease [Tessaracoccus caeni]